MVGKPNNFIDAIVWSRLYALDLQHNDSDKKCDSVFQNDNISFFVMGHCPTNQYLSKIFSEKENDNKYNYKGCTNKDCIFIGCVKNNSPRLIIVDNKISEAFIPDNKSSNEFKTKIKQFGELLLLKPTKQLNSANPVDPYYEFYRVRTSFFNPNNKNDNSEKKTEYFKIKVKLNEIEIVPTSTTEPSVGGSNKILYNKYKQKYRLLQNFYG
jgi:hypothetical protein